MASITVGTNSYVTEAELTTYATDRGVTISGDAAVLLIKAMDYLETREYIGTRSEYDQVLMWPRVIGGGWPGQYFTPDYDYYVDSETVPPRIETAQMIAALLIDGGADLQATEGRAVKRVKKKVDVIETETEYMNTAAGASYYRSLQDALKPYLAGTGLAATRA